MRKQFNVNGSCRLRLIFFVCMCFFLSFGTVLSRDLTLDQAFDIALHRTARGSIITGKEEVAAQNYRARRINFLVPEISINGSVPAYSVDESYRFFGGSSQKRLFRTRDLEFQSFIELKQSLLSGGSLTMTANLTKDDSRYPDTRATGVSFVNENSEQGFFNFRLDQPLFRPSQTKKDLYDRKNDMTIAGADRRAEEADLMKQVTGAYVGVLQYQIKKQLQQDRYDAAHLQAQIDSSKFADSIASEETWLESSSKELDAQLELVNIQLQAKDVHRKLATLLDYELEDSLVLKEPVVTDHLTAEDRQRLLNNWRQSTAIIKAQHEYEKAKREAGFSAAGHGITGDLQANYSFGRGNVKSDFSDFSTDDNINTRGWGISLNVRVPVWDGGAGSAAVKAAEFAAEQARLEYETAVRDARADLVSLMNDLDVSYRRLDIIRRQIKVARHRLDIAEARYKNGEISRVTFLDSRIKYLEQRDRYLDELKSYLTNRIELDHKFITM